MVDGKVSEIALERENTSYKDKKHMYDEGTGKLFKQVANSKFTTKSFPPQKLVAQIKLIYIKQI